MLDLKPLDPDAVPAALARAERYRLLNEPSEAQSICLDVIAADPNNQEALATMILALTDQFVSDRSVVHEAQTMVSRLNDEYERAYYTGIILERRAKAHLTHGTPGAGGRAYWWLREAMRCFDEADAIRPANNEDARLRWNACARLIDSNRSIVPTVEEAHEPLLSE